MASFSLSSETSLKAWQFSMSMAIWPDASLRKSTVSDENEFSALLARIRTPTGRPRFTVS
jgi:hypothetical protein